MRVPHVELVPLPRLSPQLLRLLDGVGISWMASRLYYIIISVGCKYDCLAVVVVAPDS